MGVVSETNQTRFSDSSKEVHREKDQQGARGMPGKATGKRDRSPVAAAIRRIESHSTSSIVSAASAEDSETSPLPGRPRSQRRIALLAKRESEEVAAAAGAAVADPEIDRDESEPEEPPEGGEDGPKKPRFVWTRDLHNRFERAVLQLGVSQAKPQAIRQLMGCEAEEDLPTRQNIKSHLQKYRLLLQKQVRTPAAASLCVASLSRPRVRRVQAQQQGNGQQSNARPSPSPTHATAPTTSASPNRMSASPASSNVRDRCAEPPRAPAQAADNMREAQAVLQQHYQGALAQLELHEGLHDQLMEQRQTQAAISWALNGPTRSTAISQPQLHRLAEHVLVQRILLQHLHRLLHAQNLGHAQFASRAAAFFDDGGVDLDLYGLELPEVDMLDVPGLEVASESGKTGGGSDLFSEHIGDDESGLGALLVPGTPPFDADGLGTGSIEVDPTPLTSTVFYECPPTGLNDDTPGASTADLPVND